MVIPALFTAASTLTAMQSGIAVISNNIANVNTTGFKYSRVHYSDQGSSSIGFASSPTSTRGGFNPKQVGTGIKLSDINTLFSQGSLKQTGVATDLSLSGSGFFVVSDQNTNAAGGNVTTTNSGTSFNAQYTRDGHFLIDQDGSLVAADGSYVLGATLYEPLSGRIKSVDNYSNITYYTDQSVGDINSPDYRPTDGVGVNLAVPVPTAVNVTGTAPNFDNTLLSELSVRGGLIDSSTSVTTGTPGDLQLSRQADGKMVFTFDDANAGTAASTFTGTFDTTQQILDNVLTINLENTAGASVQLRIRLEPGVTTLDDVFENIEYDSATATSDTLTFPSTDPSLQAGTRITIGDPDLAYITVAQINSLFEAIEIPNFFYDQDPNLEVETVNYSIESDGSVVIFGEGSEIMKLGRILVANFTNPDGLSNIGNNRYEASSNSGTAAVSVIGGPFDRSAPSIDSTLMVAGTLEAANVNIADEFAELIGQQRGLQANATSVTRADEILQTIINIA